jgi:hypothetical protein
MPRQAGAAVQQGGLVGLDDEQVVGLLAGDQELGGLGVVCSASAVTTTPARSSPSSSEANAGTSSGAPPTWCWASTARLWWSIAASRCTRAAVTACSTGAAQRLAVDGHRLPVGCGSGRSRSRWRSRSASQAPIAPARASASRRESVRRMVAWAGTAKHPGACWRVPSAARIGWGVSTTHSAIAAIDRAPASTAAAARPRMATSGWRRPRAARGSGTAAR